MEVLFKVSVQYLIHGLFRGNINLALFLSECVHQIDLSDFLGQSADTVLVGVVPPWDCERSTFGLAVTLSLSGWNVEITSSWCEVRCLVGHWVNESLWLTGGWVEPVRDVLASIKDYWIT